MRAKYLMAIAVSSMLFTACKSDSAKGVPETCVYGYSDEQTTLEWTAYKFTNKTPVKGTFNSIQLSTISNANSVKELIESIGFTIPVASLETQDELKNNNIIQGFFQTMKTDILKGTVVEVTDSDLTFEVELNGIKQKVSGSYEMTGDVLSFHGAMNLNLFNAANGIKALNEKCGDNHKGEDGITTVSDTVDIHFTTRLKKSCK